MVKKFMMMAALVAIPTIMAAPAQAKDKEYCREYTKTISVGGRSERAYGTACYKPDGSWEIVSLEGSHRARDEVREVIYKDIHKKKHRGRGKTIIIENRHKSYSHALRYHSRHHRVTYGGWPSHHWGVYEPNKYSHGKHKK